MAAACFVPPLLHRTQKGGLTARIQPIEDFLTIAHMAWREHKLDREEEPRAIRSAKSLHKESEEMRDFLFDTPMSPAYIPRPRRP